MQTLESNVLGPRIVGRAVGLHPVASILALLVGAKLFGVFGALLATPIVAAVWVVIVSIYRSAHREGTDQVHGGHADQIVAHKPALWSIHRPHKAFVIGGRGHIIGHHRSRVYLDEHTDEEDLLEDLYVNHTTLKEKCESYL
jgi:hypothetical protein